MIWRRRSRRSHVPVGRRGTVRDGWTMLLAVGMAACVREPTEALPSSVAAVQVAPAAAALAVGAFEQLTATARDAAGAVVAGHAVTWVSDRPSVATVTAAGLVTAVAPGTATVTATIDGRLGAAAVTVGSLSVDGVSCLDGSGPLV